MFEIKTIQKLIERFDSKPKSQWDESQIRTSLLNPFWHALGWEIDDPNQVEVEKRVNMKDHLRRADYAFLDSGKVIFMVEAKSPAKKLLSDRDAIFQLKRYVFNTPGTNIGILQDFEEFVPYIVFHKPNYKLPQDGLLREYVMDYKQYLERIDELIEIFSHKAVLSGSLERFIPKGRKIEKIAEPVNRAFFKDLMKWRLGIAKSIAKNNPHVSDDEINEAVNHLLNRILFLRVIEDRKIEPNEILYAEWVKWQREERGPLYAYLLELFKRNEPKYNGALFARHLCDKLIIDDKPLHDLIRNLYYPNSSYQFSVLPVEIIGNAYEQYLGSIIRLTPARRVKLEEKPEVRKAGGVYYTPKYIVDYIVEQTVGKLVEGKKPSQVRQLKILDPACGSGSFLIGAYERIVKYYIDYYAAHPNENKGFLKETREDNKKISLTLKKQILEDNIYGVDIDPRAVDITQFSLYVKMMQDEEFRGLFGAAILPDLRDNIKCGNSLIGWDILEMGILPEGEERDEILKRINPFDWEDEFPQVFTSTRSSYPLLKAYHITWVTYGSRVSERMVEYKDVIKRSRVNKGLQPLAQGVILNDEMEREITEYIAKIVKEKNLRVLAYNICQDHVHMVIVCEEEERDNIVRKLKGKSTQLYKDKHGIEGEFHLWAQKYNKSFIETEEKLRNAIEYVNDNRVKHELPENRGLQYLIQKMLEPTVNKGLQLLIEKKLEPTVYKGIIEKMYEPTVNKGSQLPIEKMLEPTVNKGLQLPIEKMLEPTVDKGFIEKKLEPTVNKGMQSFEQKRLENTVNKGLQPLVQTPAFAPQYTGGFDAVIGNPPWVQSKYIERIRKDYYSRKYRTAIKQYDKFNLFVEKSVNNLKKAGLFGYIIPSRFVMNPDYETFREFLVNNVSISCIIDVGEHIFEGVEMPSLLLFYENVISTQNNIETIVEIEDFHSQIWKSYNIPQRRFKKEKSYLFTIYEPEEIKNLTTKMVEKSITFSEIVDNARGVEIGKKHDCISLAKREGFKPFLVGEDIGRYYIKGLRWIDPTFEDVNYKDENIYKGPKILIRKTGTGINATLDLQDHWVIQVIYVFKKRIEKYDYLYLLGLLNSKLMSEYYFAKFGEKEKQAFPHLRQTCVKQLPIRTIDFSNPDDVKQHDRMVSLVEDMLSLHKRLAKAQEKRVNKGLQPPVTQKKQHTSKLSKVIQKQIEITDKKIDALVYELYGLTKEEIKIVEGEKK